MSYFNSRRADAKTPFGAVRAGTPVRYCVRGLETDALSLVLIRDGEKGGHTLLPMEKNGDAFVLEHIFAREGLYFYLFLLPDATLLVRGAGGEGVLCANRSDPPLFQQTVYAAEYAPAAGFAGGVMYQIFPDCFAVGRSGVLPLGFPERRLHANRNETPCYAPDETGAVRNLDFYGGNFQGIAEKLDYLRTLEVDCIYLNPVCEAHSNHRYNTADYKKPDPLLGTEEDFRALCAKAHKKGVRIVLDGVFSHTGDDSVYFNKYGTYPGVGACQSQDSPYYSWFKFRHWPDDYVSWWGFTTLPEVHEEDPGFIEYICGAGGVIDYWMALGADGFRLDVADELPDPFIERIRAAVKRHGSDKILIGEVWEDASNKISYGARRRYLWGRELDSVMNYPFRTAVLDFARGADAGRFMEAVGSIVENYPAPMLHTMMNMLSTHDTPRAINALVADESYRAADKATLASWVLGKDEYLRGVELLKLCFALQFTLPGIPCVYYGDEIGMQGFGDPFCRGFMRWDSADENPRAALREASLFRERNRDVLADGDFQPLFARDGAVAYLRSNKKGSVFAAVNRGEKLVSIAAPGGRTFVIGPWSSLLRRL